MGGGLLFRVGALAVLKPLQVDDVNTHGFCADDLGRALVEVSWGGDEVSSLLADAATARGADGGRPVHDDGLGLAGKGTAQNDVASAQGRSYRSFFALARWHCEGQWMLYECVRGFERGGGF